MTKDRVRDDCEKCGCFVLDSFFALEEESGNTLWVCCRCYIKYKQRRQGWVTPTGYGSAVNGVPEPS